MAITTITGIADNDIIAAFDEIPVGVATNNASATMIQCYIEYGTSLSITEYARVIDGKAYFNLKNMISSILSNTANIVEVAEDATVGAIAAEMDHAIALEVSFAEYTGTVGSYTDLYPVFFFKAAIKGTTGMAYAETINYRTAFAGQYIYPTVFKYASGDVIISGAESGNITEAVLNNSMAQFRITANHTTNDRVTLTTTTGSKSLVVDLDRNVYPRHMTLHFLNRYGGWDWYDVIDYEEVVKTDKNQYTKYTDVYGAKAIHQHVNSRVIERKCYGRQGSAERLSYIEDLITSPVVVDENGVQVRVLDDTIIRDAQGLLEPEFTIQYLEENVINY